ncbi:MAG: hypothetical protein F2840_17175 [Actinobacteria bacterium]|nr:hypothetical protein [Actinomycetota bacterium]
MTATSAAPSGVADATGALASTAAAVPADDCTKIAAAADAYFLDGKARAAAEDLLALTTRMIKEADAKRTRAVYESATEDLPELLDAIPAPLLNLGVNPRGCDQAVQDRYVAARRDLTSVLKNLIDGGGVMASNFGLGNWLYWYNRREEVGEDHAYDQFGLEGVVEYSLRPLEKRLQEYLALSEP